MLARRSRGIGGWPVVNACPPKPECRRVACGYFDEGAKITVCFGVNREFITFRSMRENADFFDRMAGTIAPAPGDLPYLAGLATPRRAAVVAWSAVFDKFF